MRPAILSLVWIGNARDAANVLGVLEHEIAAVVQLAIEEPPISYPREIVVCRFPLLDGAGNHPGLLRTTIHTVAKIIEAKIPVLVACSGGMSRSPAIVASALALANNESPDEWLQKITATGPHDIAPALWHDIRTCLREATTPRRVQHDRM